MSPITLWRKGAFAWATTVILMVHHAVALDEFYSELRPCPEACSADQGEWTLYSSVDRLSVCDEPTLFAVSLSAPIDELSQTTRVQACTAGNPEQLVNSLVGEAPAEEPASDRIAKRNDLMASCPQPTKQSSRVELASWGERDSSSQGSLDSSLRLLTKIQEWISERPSCETTAIFAHLNGTVVGYLGGARIDHKAAADDILGELSANIESSGVPKRLVMQHCGVWNDQNVSAGVAVGAIIATDGNFGPVQEALRSWNDAQCLTGASESETTSDFGLSVHEIAQPAPQPRLLARQATAECDYIRVESGDSCGKLAGKCGITPAKYMEYNSQGGHCANLAPGQVVCCSSGRLPDVTPKPNPDGSCSVYTVKSGDGCSSIATAHGLKEQDLYDLNEKTWGWSGCDPLGLGIKICLSTGSPPMPNTVSNAVCGPTKPGTRPPRGDQTLADLNPCPLKVCCNIWGQCGTTSDFCIEEKSETGAPGTSGVLNGCVQNCGMEIVNTGTAPKTFRKLAYFEAWNWDRECLHMDVRATSKGDRGYTDIHFAFGEISADFQVVIPENQQEQWEKFVDMDGERDVRKILAFGGWAFSTEPDTYQRFRDVAKPANRKGFAQRVVDFAEDNSLDGIDFDWEYPSAPDIPGIPPGDESEGADYLALLQDVRDALPDGMSLSIAAPASYWYLKGFPIARMAPLLDYIVYMTYDLHGQWDVRNSWAQPGCPAGNCLRSHVNWTETENALSMITKAGVPSHKVLLGVASYGRSFKMTTPGCKGELCTYQGGKDSPAKPGRCTETGGYISEAEIQEIVDNDGTADTWYDAELQSQFMVYQQTEWVAYMTQDIRDLRELFAKRNNFGGTAEWAADLREWLEFGGDPDEEVDERDIWDIPKECTFDPQYSSLEELGNDFDNPELAHCIPLWTLLILRDIAQKALDKYYGLLEDGYDNVFKSYAEAVQRSVRPALDNWILEEDYDVDMDDYFTCSYQRKTYCCDNCVDNDDNCPLQQDKDNCIKDSELCFIDDYDRDYTYTMDECPDVRNDKVELTTTNGNYTFKLKDGKKDEFYARLLEDVGLTEEDIDWGDLRYYHRAISYGVWVGDCDDLDEDQYEYCTWQSLLDVPRVKLGYDIDDIYNPKDPIEEGINNFKNLPAEISGHAFMLFSGLLTTLDWADLVDALVIPVLMIDGSAEAMQQAYDVGKEYEEQQRKSLIISLITAALLAIPLAGYLLPASAVALRSILFLTGDVGLAALDIYNLVDSNGEDLALGILSIVLIGAVGAPNWINLGKAARGKRDLLTKADPAAFGPRIERGLNGATKSLRYAKNTCPRYA